VAHAGATLTAAPGRGGPCNAEVEMTDKKAKVPKKAKAVKPKAVKA
jgi:hypothetical protein